MRATGIGEEVTSQKVKRRPTFLQLVDLKNNNWNTFKTWIWEFLLHHVQVLFANLAGGGVEWECGPAQQSHKEIAIVGGAPALFPTFLKSFAPLHWGIQNQSHQKTKPQRGGWPPDFFNLPHRYNVGERKRACCVVRPAPRRQVCVFPSKLWEFSMR